MQSDDAKAEGPPSGITLERHAEVSARIAEGDQSQTKVLEEQQIREQDWNAATQHWMMEMARDAQKNGMNASLAITYSDVFGSTQASLKALPPMTPEEWATLTVEIQQAGSPAQPLAVRALSTADYLRLSRYFAQLLSHDAVMNQRYSRPTRRCNRPTSDDRTPALPKRIRRR